MTVRHLVQLAGPVITAIGLLLSIWGTYLLTRWYHPFSAGGFLSTILKVVLLVARGDVATVLRRAEIATKLGSVNAEQKAESLVGLYVIFLGFLLQLLGTAFWAIDEVMGMVQSG